MYLDLMYAYFVISELEAANSQYIAKGKFYIFSEL